MPTLLAPRLREQVYLRHFASRDDLLDVAPGNASLKLSYESRRATTRSGKPSLRQTQLDPALAYNDAETFRTSDLAISITRFAGSNHLHKDRLSSQIFPDGITLAKTG